jgi:hypothetical protein
MALLRLDDAFPEHPKVLAAGGDAAWLYICGLSYSNRQLTDGFIPTTALRRLSDRKNPVVLAQRLVAVHLWDAVDAGWAIHDFLAYQRSRAEIQDERGKARDRMATHRARSADVRANEERTEAMFAEFWACYPRKLGKPAAKASFARALTKADLAEVADGLRLWCAYWKAKNDMEHVPHPTTWLNQERWNDRPPAATRPRANAGIEHLLADMNGTVIETRETP